MQAFNLSVTSQSAIFFNDLKTDFSKKLVNFSNEHTTLARFTGLPIALCFSLLNLAESIATIGESLIKGIANIFGSRFSKDCTFAKGIKQIFLQLPLHIVNCALRPIDVCYDTLTTPFFMLVNPTDSTKSMKDICEQKYQMIQDISNNTPIVINAETELGREIKKQNFTVLKHMYT